MKSTARAHSNIALIKYWGKRNEELILPFNNSVSVTLDNLWTETTVEFSKNYSEDLIILNNKKLDSNSTSYQRIQNHLELIKKQSPILRNAHARTRARVESNNNFPTASGLASSASGFAALTLAACKAANLNVTKKELSIIARQGSGSASRSIFGGFVEWEKGESSSDSFAKQLFDKNHWPEFKILVVVLETNKKEKSSRNGMQNTVKTSPFYKEWLRTIEKDISEIKDGIKNKNFSVVGKVAEHNCIKMHTTMMTSQPPLFYWKPKTLEIIHQLWDLRKNGLENYFTSDAGPQLKILCEEKNEKEILNFLSTIKGIKKIIPCSAGPGAKVIS